MPAVASLEPLPYVAASMVLQIAVRFGMPPRTPVALQAIAASGSSTLVDGPPATAPPPP